MHPFKIGEKRDPERSAIIRGVLEFRDELIALDPWLPFPQNSCCFGFGEDDRPLPVGALLLLWESWPACSGVCPECGGRVFGYGFGGLLSNGGVVGCCIDCARSAFRFVGGLGHVADDVQPILKPTPYFLKTGWLGGTVKGPRGPLVKALRRLGAANVPSATWIKGKDASGVELSIELPVI